MNTTTAAANITRHVQIANVLEGAEALLDSMYRTPCVNGRGYYPREIMAQERRVKALRDMLDSIEAPE